MSILTALHCNWYVMWRLMLNDTLFLLCTLFYVWSINLQCALVNMCVLTFMCSLSLTNYYSVTLLCPHTQHIFIESNSCFWKIKMKPEIQLFSFFSSKYIFAQGSYFGGLAQSYVQNALTGTDAVTQWVALLIHMDPLTSYFRTFGHHSYL